MSLPSSTPRTSTRSGTASASALPGPSVDEDLPAAVGDVIVEHDGLGVPVPLPDPDADGDDPDDVAPRDESTSGPDDRG